MRHSVLNWLAELVWRRPWWIVIIAAVSAAACLWYSGNSLRLNANTDDLIARDRPYMKEYRRFLDEFGYLEYISVVVASNRDAAQAERVVDALTERLRAIKELPGVYSGVEPAEQLRIATRAMPEADLTGLATACGAFATLTSANGTRPALAKTEELLKTLLSQGATLPEQEQQRIGGAAVFLLQTVASAKAGSKSDRELGFLLGRDLHKEYFKSDTGKLYFITIDPAKDYGTLSVIEEPLRKIRQVIAAARQEFPDVEIGLTGKPVLQADEMSTTNDDMTLASILAFILCAVLFMTMIGGILRPLLAVLAFAVGSAWTYGAATLLVGQLNLLSIVFMLVLVGVGLDYGVHVIARYKEWRVTHGVRESISGTIATAVRGNITGALTSSTVFFMAFFTTFQGLRELGLIAGVGLILCLIAMATVLPALLVIIDRRRKNAEAGISANSGRDEKVNDGVLGWIVRHPATVLVAVIVVSLALVVFPGRVRFEQNLLKLQATGLESIEWEHRILADSASNTWFGAVVVPVLEQVSGVIEKARQRPTIGATHSVLEIIQPPTQEREAMRVRLRECAANGATQPTTAPATQPAWKADQLKSVIGRLKLLATGASLQVPEEGKMLRGLADDLEELEANIEREARANPDAEPPTKRRIDENVRAIGESIHAMIEGERLPLRDALPDGLRRQFVSPQGRFLVMLHPKEDVWEYEPMSRFVTDLRAVDPHATGAPITHFESLSEMLRAFVQMSALALIVITALVALDFRRVTDVVLALVPLAIGMLWTIEIMGLFDVSFNLANFFSVPILIGLGVDSSVHILHRYHEGGPHRFSLGSTRRAVILTALTTIIGFGTLILAHHRGLRSLGLVMSIGSTACLVSSVVILPAMLAWLERRKARKLPAQNPANA